MTKGWENEFLSDTGFHTAFPPNSWQTRLRGIDGEVQNVATYTAQKSSGISRQNGEAFQFHGHGGDAADQACALGLADANNIGVMGFSRTSWATDSC